VVYQRCNSCIYWAWAIISSRWHRRAPGEGPPCIRHRPFGIAGARHDFPPRVRAPQRGVSCMGNLLRMG
jgi:hypothetical protein